MQTTTPHEIQPGRRHGGARPGAGAPRGPQQATLAWRNLVATLVASEVGELAHRLMPHHKVLLLAARIFMCDGEFILAERAFREAGRLLRKGARRPGPAQIKSAAKHAPPPPAPGAPTQFKTATRQPPATGPAPATSRPQHPDPTPFKTTTPHSSVIKPSGPQPPAPTQFKIESLRPRPPGTARPMPGPARPQRPAPTLFKLDRPASSRRALLHTTPLAPLPTPFLGVLPTMAAAMLPTRIPRTLACA